jgi:superkiller protein 3
VSARQVLGQALGKQHRWPEAIQQYRYVLEMNPSLEQRAGTAGLLADALFRDRQFLEATDWYGVYLASSPRDTEAMTNDAVALAVSGRLGEAVQQFRRAAELDPSNGVLQRNLANALVDMRKGDEGIVVANQAIALLPGDAAAYDVLGRALASQQRWVEAGAAFERALQLAPGDREAQDGLARSRPARGRP